MRLMFIALTQMEMADGTLAWLVLGCVITFLLSRRKGRNLMVSMAWALLSGGAGFFFGSIGTLALERITGAKIAKGAGEFFIAAFGWKWIEPVSKIIAKKAEGLGD